MGCGASSTSAEQPGITTEDSTVSLLAVEEVVRPNRSDSVKHDIIPEYWYNKRTADQGVFDDMYYVPDSEHSKFDELFAASYVARTTQDRPCPMGQHGRMPGGCPCNQPGGDPGLPIGFRVQRVLRVEASSMLGKYDRKQKHISATRGGSAGAKFAPPLLSEAVAQKHTGVFAPLDAEMNEVYAFHGTFVRYALSIAQNDFNIDLAGSSRGTLYGRGAYLGESITKADEYAKDEPDGYYAGVFSVLVCRVYMGKLYGTSDDPSAAGKIASGEFDSTCGQRLFRELVIYDADQLYPEYIVLYKRIYQRDGEAYVASLLKRRLFMEVPLHWRNNATSLREGFAEQQRGLPGINEFFQCLISAALESCSQQVVLSSRVENSELWKRYVDFKTGLRERLGGHEGAHADESSSLGFVEKDLKQLVKWPCRFHAKGSCKIGDKCRFSHTAGAANLSNIALAAGRRLPVDELDHQLNERFLWFVGTKRQSVLMSKGSFNKEGLEESFFEHIADALGCVTNPEDLIDGTKYAALCRVVCGTPGDDPGSPGGQKRTNLDCSISRSGARADVKIWNPHQVYPEYILELFSEEDMKNARNPQPSDADREQAALKIQCMARMWAARRRVQTRRDQQGARAAIEAEPSGDVPHQTSSHTIESSESLGSQLPGL